MAASSSPRYTRTCTSVADSVAEKRVHLRPARQHRDRVVQTVQGDVQAAPRARRRRRATACPRCVRSSSASASAKRCSKRCRPCARLQRSSGRKPAERDGPVVRLQELGIHLGRRPHAEDRQHQVARGQPVVGAEVAGAIGRRVLEAADRQLRALARPAIPEVPALSDQLLRCGQFQAVARLGPVRDPAAVLPQALLHLADRHVHRVTRDVRPVPRLRDHLVVPDRAAVVAQQDAQRLKRLGPQPHLDPVPGDAGVHEVHEEGSEGDLCHAVGIRI